MITFFNHVGKSKTITNFNDIIKYVLHPQTTGFYCGTQFEADMLNYIIQNESCGEVNKPGRYWWVNDDDECIDKYINEEDIDN